MAAFVGYVIQSSYVFTWAQNTAGDLPPSVDLLPEEQWDAIPVRLFLVVFQRYNNNIRIAFFSRNKFIFITSCTNYSISSFVIVHLSRVF